MRAFVDTNVVVRFLTGEPPEQAARARALFAAAAAGAIELFLPTVVLIEAGFVLRRVLRLERERVAIVLESLGNAPGLVVEQREVVQRALELFEGSTIPLADAYLAAYALVRGAPWGDPGLPAVVSFDPHFDQVDGLRRIAGPPEIPPRIHDPTQGGRHTGLSGAAPARDGVYRRAHAGAAGLAEG